MVDGVRPGGRRRPWLAYDSASALLSGAVTRTQRDHPNLPGPLYSVVGTATDLTTMVTVVCRFEPPGQLLIITCYEIE